MPAARATALLGLCLSLGLISGCSASLTLNSGDVESEIAKGLTDQVGGEFTVRCPTEIPAELGYSFACDVTSVDDGAAVTVTVTEDDAKGAFSWKVTAVEQ